MKSKRIISGIMALVSAVNMATSVSASKLGDINGDDVINVADISKVAAYIKGLRTLTEEQRTSADVNGDGKINVADITRIAAHIKGLKMIEQSSNPTDPENPMMNYTLMSLTLTASDGSALPYATICVTDKESGEVAFKGITDQTGSVSFNAADGEYNLTVLSVSSDFDMDGKIAMTTLTVGSNVANQNLKFDNISSAGGSTSPVEQNTKEVSLTFIDDKNKVIPNAKVVVTNPSNDNEVIFMGYTNGEGSVSFNAADGDYVATVESVPSSYTKGENCTHSFSVTKNDTSVGETAKIDVKKTSDTPVGNPATVVMSLFNNQKDGIPNARVVLTDLDGVKVYDGLTDENGQATFSVPSVGSYNVEVVSVPDGYTLKNGVMSKPLNVMGAYITTSIFIDAPKNGGSTDPKNPTDPVKRTNVALTFIDTMKKLLPNCKVVVTSEDSGDKVFEGFTDNSGSVNFTAPEGNYKAEVTSVPANYTLVDGKISSVIEVAGTTTKGTYTVNAVDNTSIPEQKTEFTMSIVDPKYKAVPNANVVFRLVGKTDIVATGKTDEKGMLVINLPRGQYNIEVTSVPDKYILNDGKIGSAVDIYGTTSKAAFMIDVSSSDPSDSYTKVSITVKDTNGNLLPNANVKLINTETKEVHNVGMTNKDGTVETTIAGGMYNVEVTSVTGYKVVSGKITTPIDVGGETTHCDIMVAVEKKGTGGETETNAKVTIKVVDKSNASKVVSNAIISVTDSKNNVVYEGKTNKNGEISFNAGQGTYNINLKSVPDGYKLVDIPNSTVKVNKNAETVNVTLSVPPMTSSDRITKYRMKVTDTKNVPVENVTVTLTNKDNNKTKTLTTDGNGMIYSEIPYGNYVAKITKVPDGYAFDTTVNTSNFEAKGTEMYATMQIKKKKTDAAKMCELTLIAVTKSGTALPDVTIKVHNNDKNTDQSVKTNSAGKATVKVPYGNYTMSLETVPSGYTASGVSITYDIEDEIFSARFFVPKK